MHLSVVDPVGAAITRTKAILFKPFDLGKWFVLGFCAFLAHLGEGSGSGFPTSGGPGGGGGGGGTGMPSEVQQAIDWLTVNAGLVVLVVVIILMVIALVTALILWVRSRGKFMFLDAIVLNRAAVVEPWKAFRAAGNSLFGFTFALHMITIVLGLGVIVLGATLAWPDIEAWRFSNAAITGVVTVVVLSLLLGLASLVIGVLLDDFVVPVMYLHRESVLPAWRIVRTDLLAGHGGTMVLYFLMKIGISFVVGLIAMVGVCATCCIAAIPYLGTVLLLPLFVFVRCYSICFIEQYGGGWRFFSLGDDAPRCPRCSYELRGLAAPDVCPECGMPLNPVAPPIT